MASPQTSPHLSSSGQVAHKAAMHSLHSVLFLATGLAWFQDCHPNCFRSFSILCTSMLFLGIPLSSCPLVPMTLLPCSSSCPPFSTHAQSISIFYTCSFHFFTCSLYLGPIGYFFVWCAMRPSDFQCSSETFQLKSSMLHIFIIILISQVLFWFSMYTFLSSTPA